MKIIYSSMIRKISVVIFVLHFANSSTAGIYSETFHSRANCVGFNESISWELGKSHWWRVESFHYASKTDTVPSHIIATEKALTWRSAAYHATESYSTHGDNWFVRGYHFSFPFGPNGLEWLQAYTTASGCNIYDGWWDH